MTPLTELAARVCIAAAVGVSVPGLSNAEPMLAERLVSTEFWTRLGAIAEVPTLDAVERTVYIAPLTGILEDENPEFRVAAAEALCTIGEQAASAIPAIIAGFAQANGEEAAGYASCVARFGAHAVPHLIGALESPRYFIRSRAMEALSRIGADARDATPALEAQIADSPVELDVSVLGEPATLQPVDLTAEAERALAAVRGP